MSDWLKTTVIELIKAYKEEPNLYDQKHKLYYNKQARNLSMRKILEAVQKSRSETTSNEITKKIQTLRTQFGQEVSKIDKSQSLGEDLIYKPKIFWFQHLEWIGNFMKTRSDPTPLSARPKTTLKSEGAEEQFFAFADDVEDPENYTTEIEFSEYETESEPPRKKPKTYSVPKTIKASHIIEKRDNPTVRTIEYTLIDDDTHEEIVPVEDSTLLKESAQKITACQDTNDSDYKLEKYKRRSKTFGKYVSALLMEITDDRIFFDLQRQITSSIHEASIKQNDQRKS